MVPEFKIIRRFPVYDAYTDALKGMDSEIIGYTKTIDGAQAFIDSQNRSFQESDDSTFHVYPFNDLDCQVDARQPLWDKLKAEAPEDVGPF